MAVFLGVVVLATARPGLAQDEVPELITDRPDQTESAAIVPRGWVQLELGATFANDDDGEGFDLDVVEAPGTLTRIGLSERWELRLGWAGHVDVEVGSFSDSGVGDAEIGFKYRVRDEGDGAPEVAVLFGSSLPVGDDAFTSDRADPSLRLIFAHTLSERLSVGYNLGMALKSGPAENGGVTTLSTYVYTVALGLGVSDRVGAFVELFGDVPGSAPGGPANSFDGGFTFLLRDNVQFDVAGGVGLSEAADDYFVGVGLTVRWPR